MNPQLVMLAGPNGSGKSTFYELFLAGSSLPFLNADTFAEKTKVDSVEAARVLDAMREDMVAQRHGFITETVFSDPVGAKLGMLRKALALGYDITLIYIGLSGAPLSGLRVDQRVADGGHDVPRDRLAGRYTRSLANLRAAIDLVPVVKLYDNSSAEEPYRLIAVFERGKVTQRTTGVVPAWCKPLLPPERRRTKR